MAGDDRAAGAHLPPVSALVISGNAIVALDLQEALREIGLADVSVCYDASRLRPSETPQVDVVFLDGDGEDAATLVVASAMARVALVLVGNADDRTPQTKSLSLMTIGRALGRRQLIEVLARIGLAANAMLPPEA